MLQTDKSHLLNKSYQSDDIDCYGATQDNNNNANLIPSSPSELSGNNNYVFQACNTDNNNDTTFESDLDDRNDDDGGVDHDHPFHKTTFLQAFLPFSIYLMYGVVTSMQELPMTSIAYILTNEAKFSPAELLTYYNMTLLPWTMKTLWAFLSDNIPICGYRRKPYLILSSCIAAVAFVMMVLYGFQNKKIMQALGVLVSFCICVAEIQIDALVIGVWSNTLYRRQQCLLKQYPYFKDSNVDDETDKGDDIDDDGTKTKDNLKNKQGKNRYLKILQQHPELYSLTKDDYKLLTTPELKASIQSEAMTIRTAASFFWSCCATILHVFVSPHIIILITAGLPIIIITCIGWLTEPRGELVISNNITENIVESTTTQQTLPTTLPTTDPITSSSSTTNPIPSPPPDKDDKSTIPSVCGYIFRRLKALLHALLILWKGLLFVFIMRAMPTSTDPTMSYIFGELHLPAWTLSGYGLISITAGLIASLCYWKWFTKFSLIFTFIFSTILAAICALPTACLTYQCNTKWFAIPDVAFVVITTIISAMATRLAMMPSLSLAVQACDYKNLQLEATMFTMYTTMNNVGALVSYSSSLWLLHYFNIKTSHFVNLPQMVIVCAIASLIPLLALPLVGCMQREIKAEEEGDINFANPEQLLLHTNISSTTTTTTSQNSALQGGITCYIDVPKRSDTLVINLDNNNNNN